MRILCFGDSNTYGYDPRGYFGGRYDKSDRWVDLLAEQTGWELVNGGVNGREIPRTAAFSGISGDYDGILVMLGTNDLLQGASAPEAAEWMERFLTPLLPRFRKVWLVTPPPMRRGAWVPTDELAAASIRLVEEYRNLAGTLGIPFVDTRNWEIELTFDGVHFTEEGHHHFAKRLGTVLTESSVTSGR